MTDTPEWERTHGPYKWVEIAPAEVERRLKGDHPPLVVDVREPSEHAEGVIPGAILLPLAQVPERVGELDKNREIVVTCAHGMRSAEATLFLTLRAGFTNVKSMAGGMSQWQGPEQTPS